MLYYYYELELGFESDESDLSSNLFQHILHDDEWSIHLLHIRVQSSSKANQMPSLQILSDPSASFGILPEVFIHGPFESASNMVSEALGQLFISIGTSSTAQGGGGSFKE